MDSSASASTNTLAVRLSPLAALTTHEIRTLLSGWVVRLWFLGAVLLAVAIIGGAWRIDDRQTIITKLLVPFLLFPWPVVAALIGVVPPGGMRTEVMVDAILSRPVSRYELLLSSWIARLVVSLGIFAIAAGPVVIFVLNAELANSRGQVSNWGVMTGFVIVALLLMCVVSLAFLLGTLFRNAFVALAVLIFGLLPLNFALDASSWRDLSPIRIIAGMPQVLRDSPKPTPETASSQSTTAENKPAAWFGSTSASQPTPSLRSRPNISKIAWGYTATILAAVGLAMLCFGLRDL